MVLILRRRGGAGGLLGGGNFMRLRHPIIIWLIFVCCVLLLWGVAWIRMFSLDVNNDYNNVLVEKSDLMSQIKKQQEKIEDLQQELRKKEIFREQKMGDEEEKKNLVAVMYEAEISDKDNNDNDNDNDKDSDNNRNITAIKYNNEEPSIDPSIVTFVLVATMNPNTGPRSVALLASMQRFLSPGTVHTLLVVVPELEVHWWELAAASLGPQHEQNLFAVKVLSEDSVLKSGADFLKTQAPRTIRRESNGIGYRLQMLLKLGVAQHVPTDFYVTFDCDVVLAQPLRAGVLVTNNGKGLLQGNMGGPHARRWIGNSLDAFFGRIVGSKQHKETKKYDCTVDRLMNTIGVTPAVMSKRASLLTIERLEQVAAKVIKPGMNWDLYLISTLESGLDWTEYGLYAAGTCLSGLLEEVHVADPLVKLYDAELQEDGSKWKPEDMKKVFSSKGSLEHDSIKFVFMVLQGIGGSNVVQAVSALYPHIKPISTNAH